MRYLNFAILLLSIVVTTLAADSSDDSWMQEYYQHPQPDQFESEIKKLQASGDLQNEGAMPPMAAFLSRLFQSATPAQLAEWLKFIGGLPERDQQVLLVALRWAGTPATQGALRTMAAKKDETAAYARKLLDSQAPVLDKITNPTPEELDMCWGAFFATGDSVYALTVIRCAAQPMQENKVDISQGAARWSLKALCSTDKKIRDIKDNFYKTASQQERKSLDELFKE